MGATTPTARKHALQAEGARLHVTARTLARVLQALARNGPVRSDSHRAVLAGAVAADVAVWGLLRRGRAPLWLRIAIDTIDVGAWAALDGVDLQASLASQIAAEIDAGLEWGMWGALVPALEAAASTAARRLQHRRPDVGAHASHLGAVVAGSATKWMERRRLDRARDEHDAELSAKRVRAFLAGQQSVAMGASSVVDLLAPIAMLLGASGEETALAQVRAGWKSDLAAQSRRHALYLDEAIRLWEHQHNDHPDLAAFVAARVDEGNGTHLLTGFQARSLIDLLERCNLRGTVRVRVAEPRQSSDRRPGRGFALMVNDSCVNVPPDPAVRIVEFDAGPPVMLFAACAALVPIRRQDGGVPVPAAMFSAASWLAGAWHCLGRTGDQTARRQLMLGSALATVQGAAFARTARWPRKADGTNSYHGTFGVAPLLLLLEGNSNRSTGSERRATAAALAAIVAGAYLVAPRPRPLADFAAALAWPAAAFLGATGVRAATEREAKRTLEELEAEDEREERAAFLDGRRTVLALVEKAVSEADLAVRSAACGAAFDPQDSAELHARLDEVRQLSAGLAETVSPV